jgi:hypothetical protein
MEEIPWNELKVYIGGTKDIPIDITSCTIEKINDDWLRVEIQWDYYGWAINYAFVELLGCGYYCGPICHLKFQETGEKFQVELCHDKHDQLKMHGKYIETQHNCVKIYFAKMHWIEDATLIKNEINLREE